MGAAVGAGGLVQLLQASEACLSAGSSERARGIGVYRGVDYAVLIMIINCDGPGQTYSLSLQEPLCLSDD